MLGYPSSTATPTGPSTLRPGTTADATGLVLRATAIVSLAGIAVIHVAQIVTTFQQSAVLGSGFVVLILACVFAAARLVRGGAPADWIGVAIICGAALAGYALTRLWSTPLDMQDVGNWSEALGLVALFVEGGLLILSGYALRALAPIRG